MQKSGGKQRLLKHPDVLRYGLCALSLGPLITRLGNQNKLELQLVIQNTQWAVLMLGWAMQVEL